MTASRFEPSRREGIEVALADPTGKEAARQLAAKLAERADTEARIEAMAKAAATKYWRSFSKEFRPDKESDWEHCSNSTKDVWRRIEASALDALRKQEAKEWEPE